MYVSRDKDGNIKGYTRWPSPGSTEKVEEDDQEFIDFKQKIHSQETTTLSKEEITWMKAFIAAEKAKRI